MTMQLLNTLTTTIVCGWQLAGCALIMLRLSSRAAPTIVRTVFFELRPLYLPALAVDTVLEILLGQYDPPWDWALTAIQLWNWFGLKDQGGDDDRWKRRRRKAADKVQQLGGRLVVAPAGTS